MGGLRCEGGVGDGAVGDGCVLVRLKAALGRPGLAWRLGLAADWTDGYAGHGTCGHRSAPVGISWSLGYLLMSAVAGSSLAARVLLSPEPSDGLTVLRST